METRDYPEAGTLTSPDLKAFLAELRTVPNGRGKLLSSKTIYNAWVALRRFYRWLAEETGVPNPMLAVAAPRAQTAVIEPLTKEQVEAIIKACDDTQVAKTQQRSMAVCGRASCAN